MVDKYVCMDNGFAFSILDQVNGIILFQISDHQINQSTFSKGKKKKKNPTRQIDAAKLYIIEEDLCLWHILTHFWFY